MFFFRKNYYFKLFTDKMGLANAWRFSLMFKNHIKFDLLSLLLYITTVKAEIRCYCNQPSCVPTGYMCKSMSGACFTELFSHSNDLSKSRHGCVELLSAPKKDRCISPTTVVSHLPVMFCCKEDMCNYMNALDINIQIRAKSNQSQLTGTYNHKEHRAYENALQQDLWFKAAVIAVPIAGGFILILLILLATRMLRQDSKRQRQLLELRRQQTSGNKSQILFGQPCLNHPNCSFEILAQDSKSNEGLGNVNFSLSRDSWCADATFNGIERQYVYDRDNRHSAFVSLLPWTKWNPPKLSTHV